MLLQVNSRQCGTGCASVMNCCMTSQPCQNGGTCLPSSPKRPKRFRCNCATSYRGPRCKQCVVGYTGPQCDQPIKSCRGYFQKSATSGNYKIFSCNMHLIDVYCDFDKNSSMAWTLIQSFKLRFVHLFKSSFFENKPVYDDNPSWQNYRLSKSKMESIHQDSSKWRITCDYQSSGTVYTDYVRVSNKKVNILTFNNISCVEVEYINIRGHHCSNCMALMIQTHNKIHFRYIVPLHFESYFAAAMCTFRPTGGLSSKGRSEDNFGFYDSRNDKHRCSASQNATTQTWFGGDL